MKIAQIATINLPIPNAYGGVERVVSDLSSELMKNNEVTVFASSDSKIKHKKSFIGAHVAGDYMKDPKVILAHLIHLSKSIAYAEKYNDIIHCHVSYLPHLFSEYSRRPIAITLHGTNDSQKYPERMDILRKFRNVYLISISKNQRKDFPGVKFFSNIYNGVDTSIFKNKNQNQIPRQYLLWVGRFDYKKGPHVAIKIARKCKTKLILVGPKYYQDSDYFDKEIKPFIDRENVVYLGEKTKDELPDIYSNAIATLMPINFEEPFGLIAIESMSCGTPVIAFKRGALPEIINNNVNGFLCPQNDLNHMKKMVINILAKSDKQYKDLSLACRTHIENNFSLQYMTKSYEEVYKKIIEDWKKKNK